MRIEKFLVHANCFSASDDGHSAFSSCCGDLMSDGVRSDIRSVEGVERPDVDLHLVIGPDQVACHCLACRPTEVDHALGLLKVDPSDAFTAPQIPRSRSPLRGLPLVTGDPRSLLASRDPPRFSRGSQLTPFRSRYRAHWIVAAADAWRPQLLTSDRRCGLRESPQDIKKSPLGRGPVQTR